MKLSEAIRLGAMLKPQCHGSVRIQDRTCALGAAGDALGIDGGMVHLCGALHDLYPFLYDERHACPRCGNRDLVMDVIWHLNDVHKWTREQIADFVQGIEEAHESPRTADAVAAPSRVTEVSPVRA